MDMKKPTELELVQDDIRDYHLEVKKKVLEKVRGANAMRDQAINNLNLAFDQLIQSIGWEPPIEPKVSYTEFEWDGTKEDVPRVRDLLDQGKVEYDQINGKILVHLSKGRAWIGPKTKIKKDTKTGALFV